MLPEASHVGRLAVHPAALAGEEPAAHAQRGEQQPPASLGGLRPPVLGEEQQVAAEVLPVQTASVRGAADVDALGSREEEDLPARPVEPVAPVGLLAEEEVVLVEEADPLDRAPAHEHAGTHDELRLAHLVVVEPARVEAVEERRPRRELAQEEVLGRKPPQGREAAHGPLETAVLVQQTGGDDRRLGSPVGERDEPRDRVADEPRVGVQEQDVPALRPADAVIPTGSEPAVLGFEQRHVRKAVADELDRAVSRPVVDDDGRDAGKALQAALDPRQRVVGDDDRHDVGGRAGTAVTHARPAGGCRDASLPGSSRRRRAVTGERSRGRRGTPPRTPARRPRRDFPESSRRTPP